MAFTIKPVAVVCLARHVFHDSFSMLQVFMEVSIVHITVRIGFFAAVRSLTFKELSDVKFSVMCF